jgi:hypothetical protein
MANFTEEMLIHETNCSLAVLDAATRMKKREDNSDVHDAIFAQVAKCTEFDVGIFEYLF